MLFENKGEVGHSIVSVSFWLQIEILKAGWIQNTDGELNNE
jgi:hypothetical protein